MLADKAIKKDVFSPKRKTDTPNADKREDNFESEKKNEENKDSVESPSKYVASPIMGIYKKSCLKEKKKNLFSSENEDKVKRIAFEQAKEQAISNVTQNIIYIVLKKNFL